MEKIETNDTIAYVEYHFSEDAIAIEKYLVGQFIYDHYFDIYLDLFKDLLVQLNDDRSWDFTKFHFALYCELCKIS